MTGSLVRDVADAYFEAWQAGDYARLRSVLADGVTFDGPLGHAGSGTAINGTGTPREHRSPGRQPCSPHTVNLRWADHPIPR